MEYRQLGKTGYRVSALSLGTWQVGGRWGSGFDDANAEYILHRAIDAGINFIDTADVYENGLSEAAVGRVVRARKAEVYIATKCGRRLQPHHAEAYQPDVLRSFVEDSLKNLGRESIDLIQLHCPPTEVYYRPEIFELFGRLREEGKIRHLGVSVQKVEEGIKALNYPEVAAVQIIFNMFRQRPAERFFREAAEKDVGIIVRVPLASGLLTGLYRRDTLFGSGDHRHFNRGGAAFDRGETFGGIPYEVGIAAMEEIKALFPGRENLAPVALKWILQFPEVSCVIPGASHAGQLAGNLQALNEPVIAPTEWNAIRSVYDRHIRRHVHEQW
jgi:aryl-alcohol dehydrogenase-like predicted oxidoreductase